MLFHIAKFIEIYNFDFFFYIYCSMSCGVVSRDSPLLAAGYTNSEVRLWSLTDDKLPRGKQGRGSRVRVAIDLETESQKPQHSGDEMKTSGDEVLT